MMPHLIKKGSLATCKTTNRVGVHGYPCYSIRFFSSPLFLKCERECRRINGRVFVFDFKAHLNLLYIRR